MKAIELRIGNSIIYNGGLPEDVDEITIVEIADIVWLQQNNYEFNKYHKPIPLTEEWLLRFGFERNDNYKIKEFVRGDMIIYTYNKVNKEVYYGICVEVKIKYIHQLQNLYFALTGRELKTD